MTAETTYRIFISYSHDDAELKNKLVAVLEANGLQPMHDKGFGIGSGFPDQIKNYIAHAHVFMPILTKKSSGWVHQEIGYAAALNIPVVPISYEQNPGQMIRELHAVQWDNSEDWLEKNKDKLSRGELDRLMDERQEDSSPLYECADLQEERTETIVNYAKKVIALGGHGMVRQKGALSSFHIPDDPVSHPVWRERYGNFQASKLRCKLQLKERLILQKHAETCGCRIIIDPSLTYSKYGEQARISRLNELLYFFEEIPADKVQVAIDEEMSTIHNILIVGDWFVAESKTAEQGKGYEQTTFTRHTPTIQYQIEEFDREFLSLLDRQGTEPENSVEHAIKHIKKRIEKPSSRPERSR